MLAGSETLIFSSTERRKRSSGGAVFAGDGIGDLALVERGLDLIEILLQQLLRLVLEGGEQGPMHVLLDPAVVELLARRHQMIEPGLFLLGIHARIALDARP